MEQVEREYISLQQLGTFLGISEQTARRLVKSGKIPYINAAPDGERELIRVSIKDVETWISEQKPKE